MLFDSIASGVKAWGVPVGKITSGEKGECAKIAGTIALVRVSIGERWSMGRSVHHTYLDGVQTSHQSHSWCDAVQTGQQNQIRKRASSS